MKFFNAHHHSTFSFGDGYGTPKQHVQRAVELGYPAIALTEHGNVSSHFQLEKYAIELGIKPVFGLEAYCGPVEETTRSQWKYHLTILAENIEGYRNLNRIVTQSYNDYYFHPTVSGSSLTNNSEGIIVLSGCSGSLLACTLLGGKGSPDHIDSPDYVGAEELIWKFKEVFGDRYFLEIQPFYELEKTCAMNQAYVNLSEDLGVPLVVTNDVHYPRMEDAEMQAVLHAVHRHKASVDDAMREWNYDVPLTLPSSDQKLANRIIKTGVPKDKAWDAIENSTYIGDICNVTLPKAERLKYPINDMDNKPWT